MYNLQPKVCFFEKNHTIKKKKRQKKGVETVENPNFFNPKTHKSPQKSTQRHPGEDHAPGRDHLARTLGRSTAPCGTRGGGARNRPETGFRNVEISGVWKKEGCNFCLDRNTETQKIVWSLEKKPKKNCLEDSMFWSFWGFYFSMYFPALIVFGYGPMVVFGCFRFNSWWFDHVFGAVSTGLRPRRDLLHRMPFGHLRRLAENLQLSTILLDEGEQRWMMVNRRNCSNEHYWARLFKETVFVLEVGEKNEMPQMPQMSTKPRLVD